MKAINLNRREKYVVAGLAVFILVCLVYKIAISPILDKRGRLDRALDIKAVELNEIRQLRADYLMLQEKAESAEANFARRDRNFSLYSFLESLSRDVGIKPSSMRESSSSSQGDSNIRTATVDLKLQGITMEQLSKYLYRIEYSGNSIYIKRMSITETKKPEEFINVQLQVETIVT